MKKGFTLVELSIVPVIIGLLIGGILAAQSMIATAKINSAIKKIQQFDMAVSNFETKYNQFPGDSTLFSSSGDNNGYLSHAGTIGNGGGSFFLSEIANFWVHLQKGGFTYSNATFTATVAGSGFDIKSSTPNAPSIDLDVKSAVTAMAPCCFGADSNVNSNIHYSFFDKQGELGLVSVYDGAATMKASTTQALDSKLDDGNPVAGNVTAAYNSSLLTCYSGSRYSISTPGIICSMYIRVLSQAKGR